MAGGKALERSARSSRIRKTPYARPATPATPSGAVRGGSGVRHAAVKVITDLQSQFARPSSSQHRLRDEGGTKQRCIYMWTCRRREYPPQASAMGLGPVVGLACLVVSLAY